MNPDLWIQSRTIPAWVSNIPEGQQVTRHASIAGF
jgi:hypothetical protein